jgi:hypothetical protein
MTSPDRKTCQYCSTLNPTEEESCLACGAPLINIQPVNIHKHKNAEQAIIEEPLKTKEVELKKIGEAADDVYFKVYNTYAIAWRTVGEAIAIAVSSFIIGLAGGATQMQALGIIGAVLLGATVGFTHKIFYFVLVSAPAGALLGLLIGGIVWVTITPQAMVFIVTGVSILAAILGGRRVRPFKRRNWWEKARPFLGALGGLGFGMLGMLVGWGIRSAIDALLN